MANELQLRCACEGCPNVAAERRQDTAYADDSDNFATLCLWHQRETDDYWRERWEDYYGGLL